MEHLIELAKKAIEEGKTRGRFIRENSNPSDSREFLQKLSNAYSEAMCSLTAKES